MYVGIYIGIYRKILRYYSIYQGLASNPNMWLQNYFALIGAFRPTIENVYGPYREYVGAIGIRW